MPELGASSKKRRRTGFRLFNRQQSSTPAQKPARDSAQPPWMDELLPSSSFDRAGSISSNQKDSNQRGDVSSVKPKKASFKPFGWLLGRRSRRRSESVREKRQQTDGKALKRSPSSFEISAFNPSTSYGNSKLSASQRRTIASDRKNQRSLAPDSTELHRNRSLYTSNDTTSSTNPIRAFDSSRQPSQNSGLTQGFDTQLQGNNPTLLQEKKQQQTVLQQSTLLQGRKDSQGGARARKQRRKSEPVDFTPRSRSMAIALYAARMLILSVGVGVLAGTVLSAWNPTNAPFTAGLQTIKQSTAPSIQESPSAPLSEVKLAQEMMPLKAGLQTLLQQNPKFKPGVFLVDLDSNDYLDLSGAASFSAASMIKVPVLIAFFQDLDKGKIRLDEKLVMRQEMVGGGSGDLQYLPVGSQFTALDTATRMITISDNTATNMLITRLGGMSSLNQRFKSWGLSTTALNKPLPDLQGTNTSSPKELASLMVRVSQGDLVSLRSRDRMLDIMRRTINNSQLPQGLGEGATIAHKTGDIGTLVGDVGLIDMPNGKRYATAVFVKRGFNDDAAYDLVQKISRLSYQHLSQPKAAPSISPTPTPSTPPNP
ncbi:serine hydrolase [Leptolyngbyaceae cyanobacterium UHCC 1019]